MGNLCGLFAGFFKQVLVDALLGAGSPVDITTELHMGQVRMPFGIMLPLFRVCCHVY